MLKKNMLFASSALALTLVFSSCSILKGQSGPSTSKKEPTTTQSTLPSDRASINSAKTSKTYTPEDIKNGVVKGDWAIESVNGKKVVGETAPFLKFVPETGRVYGNNGCNVVNAEYKYNAKSSTINFDYLSTTMRLCATEGLTDFDINAALGATKFYSVSSKGNDYFLTFYDESHQPVMQLMHQNFEFLNGTWKVTKINEEPVDVDGLKLVMDVDEGKVHGDTGCNIFNGTLDTDMEQPNSISFNQIALTRMMCPDIKYENTYMVALEEACSARPVSNNEVVLYNDQNEPVLTLVRTTDR